MDLTGQILISKPSYSNEWFSNSGVFIYEHTPNGAAGLILNKDSNVTVAEIFKNNNIDYNGNEPVYRGGPVNGKSIIMLHSTEWKSQNTYKISEEFSVTSDMSMMQLIASGSKPRQWRMFVGLAGWAPGQLEEEIMGQNAFDNSTTWLKTTATPGLVYNYNGHDQWNRLVEQAGSEMFSQYL